MKLFQIEEPDGSPSDPEAPGAAIGIDATAARGEVAFAVGGNAVRLEDREGVALDLPVPPADAPAGDWRIFFEGARLRAERALGRPVTHAVVATAAVNAAKLAGAAETAGISLLHVMAPEGRGQPPVFAAAVMAEDLAPRPESP